MKTRVDFSGLTQVVVTCYTAAQGVGAPRERAKRQIEAWMLDPSLKQEDRQAIVDFYKGKFNRKRERPRGPSLKGDITRWAVELLKEAERQLKAAGFRGFRKEAVRQVGSHLKKLGYHLDEGTISNARQRGKKGRAPRPPKVN
jgi:DNA-directed RNA polymerase beta' subunit